MEQGTHIFKVTFAVSWGMFLGMWGTLANVLAGIGCTLEQTMPRQLQAPARRMWSPGSIRWNGWGQWTLRSTQLVAWPKFDTFVLFMSSCFVPFFCYLATWHQGPTYLPVLIYVTHCQQGNISVLQEREVDMLIYVETNLGPLTSIKDLLARNRGQLNPSCISWIK